MAPSSEMRRDLHDQSPLISANLVKVAQSYGRTPPGWMTRKSEDNLDYLKLPPAPSALITRVWRQLMNNLAANKARV